MPGVPRSKGCGNCRRRKKGCDLENPCGRCVRLGLQCQFGRQLKFVDETQPEKHKSTKSITVDNGHSVPIYESSESGSGTPDSGLLQDLAVSAHQTNAIGAFWDAYATSGFGNRTTTMTSQKWLRDVVHESSNPALRSALLSLAAGRLSRLSGHQDASRQAAMQYSICIAEIRKALNHPRRRYDDGLLAAVMVLGTYEVRSLRLQSLVRRDLLTVHDRFMKAVSVEGQPGSPMSMVPLSSSPYEANVTPAPTSPKFCILDMQ